MKSSVIRGLVMFVGRRRLRAPWLAGLYLRSNRSLRNCFRNASRRLMAEVEALGGYVGRGRKRTHRHLTPMSAPAFRQSAGPKWPAHAVDPRSLRDGLKAPSAST